jgi:TonB-linked SusC/RagA family outer membrane protein
MVKYYSVAIVIALFFCCAFEASAQDRIITGTVLSADDQEPLPGVSVVVSGTSRGTTTDLDGRYRIDIEEGDERLTFSFVGYKPRHMPIEDQSRIDVELSPAVKQMDEVVVIGYGSVRKSDLTGSVSSVSTEDLVKIPNQNPVQALQGKVAGVQVNAASGAPGAQPVVRIRGVGTFGNAAPIYVVDGMIVDDISFLNAADIASMEVLKDASAIAIYGARGANGVVLVTTRQGKKGKARINVNSEFSMQQVNNHIDLLNGRQFAGVVNEIRPGSYNNVDAVPDTDWQSLIFRPAPIHNHRASISGATDNINYYLGISYFRQEGVIEKSNFERFTLRLNNEYRLNDQLRFGHNITFAPQWQQQTAGGVVFGAYRAQPVVRPYNDDGSFAEVPGVGNPLADIEYSNNFNRRFRTVGNLYGELDITEGLSLRSSFGVDMNFSRGRNFAPVFYVSPQQQNEISRLTVNHNESSTLLWENTLNYDNEFGKHRIGAVAGYTMQETSSQFYSALGENLLRENEDFWYINPNNVNPNSVNTGVDVNQHYSMLSYLGRINYVYDQRYLLTASYRVDGSSKFTSGNRFAHFPALALGWNISNEEFMQDINRLSFLKLRASWGATGNEKIDFTQQYSRVLNQVDAVFGTSPALHSGATFGVLGNPDLLWETTYQTDFGLEVGLFNDRFTAEVDYFNRLTTDILIALPVPGYLGNGEGARITFNAAEVQNRGVEFNFNWHDQIQDFSYGIGVRGNTLQNKVLAISGSGGSDESLEGGFVFNRFVTRTTVGEPIGYYYGYLIDGVFQNQEELDAYPSGSQAKIGDLRYVDTSGDGSLNQDDRVMIGSAIPDLVYGFSFEMAYKAFSLDLDFQGEYGREIYNAKETVRPDLYNFEAHVYDRWTGEGTSNTEPRAMAGGYNWQPSTRFVQDGSYLRLRNVTLAYQLPAPLAERLRLQAARLYLSGVNVFTLTNYTGYSPEFGSEDVLSNGLDMGVYPVPAIYSIGFNVTF